MHDKGRVLSNWRLPDPVFRNIAWRQASDILEVKRFSIPAVEPKI
jgi:hypothetical protein